MLRTSEITRITSGLTLFSIKKNILCNDYIRDVILKLITCNIRILIWKVLHVKFQITNFKIRFIKRDFKKIFQNKKFTVSPQVILIN